MANPGGVGNKFVSVNLNKSYGRNPNSISHAPNSMGSRYRPPSHGSGGMVVLSRPRSSLSGGPKMGPRLSVPPPLNLPSLRKEHEKFDLLASGGSGGTGPAGSGSAHSTSAMGWTKPGLLEKDGTVAPHDDGTVGASTYVPPAARAASSSSSSAAVVSVEKAVVLRGEDFPSLRAAIPMISSGPSQRQKDLPKQKQRTNNELSQEKLEKSNSGSELHMRPQIRSRFTVGPISEDNGESSLKSSGILTTSDKAPKQDSLFSVPLSLVRLTHTSDWADDERDTGHGIPDREKDNGYSRGQRDFDIPKPGIPRAPSNDFMDGRVSRDVDNGKVLSRGGDSYGRDVRTPSREGPDGSSWRSSQLPKDGFNSRDMGSDRSGIGARSFSLGRDMGRDNAVKYNDSSYRDNCRDGFSSAAYGSQDSRYSRRDSSHGNALQNGVRSAEIFGNKGNEQNTGGRYGDSISNRLRNDIFQSSSTSKSSFSSGSKGFSVNDPILNFGRERRLFSNSKSYMEETLGNSGFDGRDPFSGGLFLKKKKDVKQTDFHDPVRESFEAELERVQKMQEQERQRIAEEQARALEQARKEEEERQRLAREEEERRRRLEEEAREAAWRAEKERLEALRRSEEQRIAREEEKRRIHFEEERRKEAARQKLLDLEAMMAKRQVLSANSEKVDERLIQNDAQRVADIGDWEDGERMVQRITSSASSDSSGLNRTFDTGSRLQSTRDGNSAYVDRGKQVNSWKRDAFENGNNSHFHDSDSSYRSPRREQFNGGKSLTRKEFYGGPGVMPLRKGGMPEPHPLDDFPQFRGQRWNAPTESDNYSRNAEFDYEFPENSMDKFADIGWGQGRLRNIPHSPISDRVYQNPEVDGFSSFGRSRHSMRQPRVLPPPITSVHRSSFRTHSDHSGSSVFADDEARFSHGAGRNGDMAQISYEGEYSQQAGESGVATSSGHDQFKPHVKAAEKHASRCDSQSSLSVSSPPNSPTLLSHDDLDDTGGSPGSHAVIETEQTAFSDNDQVVSASRDVQGNNLMNSHITSPDEDEEWTVENNEDLQQQEEYDEEEDGGYQEEDEVHEGEDENLHLSHEFADLVEEHSQSDKVDQLVLGFDEGIEVRVPSSEEFEKASQNNDKSVGMQETGSADGLVADTQGFKTDSSFTERKLENGAKLLHGSEKASEELVMQPASSTDASSTEALVNVEEHISFLPLHQQPVASSTASVLSSQLVQPISSSVSSIPSQTEVPPVKLQFGLFSGPSLIPSPVPAIQIGSIQMPLLHPPVGSSLTQIHPSQPPYFQFGQLRYTSPISQGILPLGPQTLSFVQPNAPPHFLLNQQIAAPLHNQCEGSAADISKLSVLSENQTGRDLDFLDPSHVNQGKELTESKIADSSVKGACNCPDLVESSRFDENKARPYSISQVGDQTLHDKSGRKNYRSVAGNGEIQGQSSRSFSSDRVYDGSIPLGMAPSGKGKRLIYTVKNNGSRSSVVPTSEGPHLDSSGLQRKVRRNLKRTEFRVRENVDKRQAEGLVSLNYLGQEEKLIPSAKVSANFIKGAVRKDGLLNKPFKSDSGSYQTSGSLNARNTDSESRMGRTSVRDAPSKRQISALEGKSNINGRAGEDVDPPLQSGVVRVFKQSGIEAPSDEDDFIEVRSKRQMLNDRREQREKELKAKSRVIKAPRKPRSVSQTTGSSNSFRGTPASVGGDMASCVHSESDKKDGRNTVNVEVPIVTAIASLPLPPIGTPTFNADAQANIRSFNMKSIQAGPTPVISCSGTNFMPTLAFETKTAVVENVPTSLAPWASPRISQQVMALTQTQLDEAMKPGRFDANVSPIVDHTTVKEPNKPSASILSQDGKSFSSAASPLNSLLAGEKIQFGAVTSPTILPPSTCSISNGIGPSASCRSEVPIDHKLSASDSVFYDKERHAVEPCAQLEDSEAEAEAAASAVAVAAISNDEVVGNGLSVSVADSKSFGSSDIGGLSSGGASSNQQSSNHSKGEESLTVALPADLSVETPSLPLWPPLSSPSNSSNPMLSPFPGAPPFPCYEMNPMLGGPIFAFGPQDESVNTKSQSQKGSMSTTGPIGAWQQCHSGVDSFYGPPTGFSGPFISPPGGIPGMQGPPHMVVYNHFAPVGQFGQVGLSFMGTTYIPSGKQPDWKHNPVSSAVGITEGDINSINIASAQRNPQNLTGPIQHLASGSPLLPMASPLAMFDMSPFQSTADMPMQARWPHVPASPLHSVPLSMPLQQADGMIPSQFNHGLSVDPSTGERLNESRASAPMETSRKFSAAGSASQFPDELGLVDSTNTNASLVSTSRSGSYNSTNGSSSRPQSAAKSSSRSSVIHATENGNISSNGNGSSGTGNNATLKSQSSQQQNSSYLHPVGYSDQRRSVSSQKNNSGGEWHRRVGFQARNQTAGSEKNFSGASKMKQIYVAKPATTSAPTTAV